RLRVRQPVQVPVAAAAHARLGPGPWHSRPGRVAGNEPPVPRLGGAQDRAVHEGRPGFARSRAKLSEPRLEKSRRFYAAAYAAAGPSGGRTGAHSLSQMFTLPAPRVKLSSDCG